MAPRAEQPREQSNKARVVEGHVPAGEAAPVPIHLEMVHVAADEGGGLEDVPIAVLAVRCRVIPFAIGGHGLVPRGVRIGAMRSQVRM